MNTTLKRQFAFKSATLWMLSFLAFAVGCTTPRTAKVAVVNETGEPIDSITVMHKYSDVHKDTQTWTNIASRATSQPMNVRYNTGFLTTGKDWWIVTWVNANGTNVTAPNNFRQFIDPVEQALVSGDTNQINKYLSSINITIPADVVASVFYKVVANQFFNTEPTVGFKQHILRSADADTNKVTTITIYQEGDSFPGVNNTNTWTHGFWNRFWYGLPVTDAVVFDSESGHSVTVYSNLTHRAEVKAGADGRTVVK